MDRVVEITKNEISAKQDLQVFLKTSGKTQRKPIFTDWLSSKEPLNLVDKR